MALPKSSWDANRKILEARKNRVSQEKNRIINRYFTENDTLLIY